MADEEFEHDEFVKEEFGGEPKPRGISWLWWITALLLIALSVFFLLH